MNGKFNSAGDSEEIFSRPPPLWCMKPKMLIAGGYFTILFSEDFIFVGQFQVLSQLEGKVQRFSVCSLHYTCVVSLTINIPHQTDTFVTIGEPKFIHHNHSKSIVCIPGHSLYCVSDGFGHMYMKVSIIIISHREFLLS